MFEKEPNKNKTRYFLKDEDGYRSVETVDR
jgi:hypothetical protein